MYTECISTQRALASIQVLPQRQQRNNFLICCRLAWHNASITSITRFLAANLTNVFRTRATISSHHCELLIHNNRAMQIDCSVIKETIAHSFIHYFTCMIGAAREKFLFMTVAVDGNALSDVCGLNLQYHCKTVSRQCKVHSFGLRR